MPREHGLWSWMSAPLCLVFGLEPTLTVALGCLSIVLGFFAINALRAAKVHLATWLGVAGATLALLIVPALPTPLGWSLGYASFALAGRFGSRRPGVGLGRSGVRDPEATWWEVSAIAGFAVLALALGVAAGLPAGWLSTAMLGLVSFELAGLYWVRRELSRVLPGRSGWTAGPALVLGSAAAAVALALWAGAPHLGALPALYLLRILTTRAAATARDARRLGLGEAAWAALAVGLVVGAA